MARGGVGLIWNDSGWYVGNCLSHILRSSISLLVMITPAVCCVPFDNLPLNSRYSARYHSNTQFCCGNRRPVVRYTYFHGLTGNIISIIIAT